VQMGDGGGCSVGMARRVMLGECPSRLSLQPGGGAGGQGGKVGGWKVGDGGRCTAGMGQEGDARGADQHWWQQDTFHAQYRTE
jgi:hypothetical protein